MYANGIYTSYKTNKGQTIDILCLDQSTYPSRFAPALDVVSSADNKRAHHHRHLHLDGEGRACCWMTGEGEEQGVVLRMSVLV